MASRTTLAIIAIVVVFILVIGVYAGITLSKKQSTPTTNIVTYASSSPMVTADPSTEFSNSILVLQNVYQTLTFYNSKTKTVEPLLALNWTSNSNSTDWVFTLRQGVKFHDGTTFNASAVVYSIDRTIRLGEGAAYIWAPVKEIRAISTYEVQIITSYPANIPLIASSGYGAYIMSPNIRSVYNVKGNISAWFNAGHDDGTGPYYITQWNPQTQVTLQKFNDYWGGWNNSQFSVVIIKIVTNYATREQMVTAAGSMMITSYIPYTDINNLKKDPNVDVYVSPSYENLIAFYNTLKYPTNITLVREALSYAWPYQEIINTSLSGYATQSRGPIPVGMWGHDNKLMQYSYNLTMANKLLAEAGFPNGTGFPTLTLTYTAGDPYEQASSQLFQFALSKLNITVKIEPLIWTQQWSLATSNPSTAQNIFLMYWWPTYPTPYDWLSNCFGNSWPPVFNVAYWNNTTFINLINEAHNLEGTNINQSIALYYQAQQVLMNNTPAAFLFDMDDVYVVSSSIHGFAANPAYETVAWFYNLYV
ncbi:MAG: ABC transporter substrate-binding protein [Nitrososphaerota archaeon]